jgi:uncharacterized protein YlxP (DUF503 family)
MSTLDPTHDRAIDLMLGSGLTTLPVDNAKAVLLLRATNGDPIVFRTILAKRAVHREWITRVQREWQIKLRTISDADIERRRVLWDCSLVSSDSQVRAVMVGDDREHIVDIDDLTELGELDYCAECGQIGCAHDGRDRE